MKQLFQLGTAAFWGIQSLRSDGNHAKVGARPKGAQGGGILEAAKLIERLHFKVGLKQKTVKYYAYLCYLKGNKWCTKALAVLSSGLG